VRAVVGFVALGIFWGALGAALPAVQRHAGADDGQLGVALLLVGLGALISMRAAGVLIDRLGPRVTPITVGLFGITAILPALADSPGRLYVFLLAVGAASGAMDVAINADAVREEVRTGRPLLNLAHAGFSLGVVAASLATGLLRSGGAGLGTVFGATGIVVLASAIAMRPSEPWERPPSEARPRFFERVPSWLLVIGALGAIAFWIEGAWQDWSAVHLERAFDATPGASALGPALFAGAMAVGRLTAHALARPGSERVVLVVGAALAGAGSVLAAVAPSAPLALLGIAVAGAGCSVCAPTLVSLAGNAAEPRERATVVGSLTTVMYLGFLVGPAAVGGLADATSLRASLGTVGALGFLLAGLFALVRFPRRAST
jgi:MFS family permease